jgi:dTDP-4-amino-4,6-dideoxygalactose transaminase
MPVHLFGQCVEMEPLWRIAVRHGLPIIEDAAQALGAKYRGRRAGVLGTIGCFSFFPTKNLGGAGDGGLMTTDDRDLSARLRRLRVHGDTGGYQHVEAGINSRLDALQAAVLSVKLKHLDNWSIARAANAARYTAGIEERGLTDLIEVPRTSPDREHVFNQYCIRIGEEQRDAVAASLKQQQVGCAVYYPKPLHLQPCFERWGYKEGDFPEAERASREILALPIYPELGESRQQIVLDTLAEAVAAARGSARESLRKAA